jgi:nucleoside-diphosphate-sugar epimerase
MREGAACLVTGGAGFIGSNLVTALLEGGMSVRILDDLSTGDRRNLSGRAADAELIAGDVRDPAALARAVEGVEVIFHEAAIPSVARSVQDPLASHAVNATGTLNVLIAARDASVERVVYASSAAVYGNASSPPLHEGLPTRPASPYGASKLAGERYLEAFARTWGMATIALRYLNVFGPRQDPRSQYASAIPRFIAAALARDAPTIYGDGEQARDFIYVDDVVRANLCAADASHDAIGGAFNVGYGERHTVNELVATIRELVPGEHPPPIHADPRPGDIRDSWSDITAAREVLGFEPEETFEGGLRRTVEWFTGERAREPR